MVKIIREKPERVPRNVAYLRVSTLEQDTQKNQADVLKFANDRKFGTVEFIEEKVSGNIRWMKRKIKQIIDELESGDRLILPEISRMGRSMLEIMEMLSIAKQKGIAIYDIKNGFEINGRFQGELMAMIFSMAAQIERDLISSRTKEGIAHARSSGKILGRPKGPGKSKLDPFRPEIEALLKNGSTKTFIAGRYGTTLPNLFNWLQKNAIGQIKTHKKGGDNLPSHRKEPPTTQI
jgi:DNA invertase Pin-like site-specific DNA recombinase